MIQSEIFCRTRLIYNKIVFQSNTIYSCDLDPITLIDDLDLDILKMYLHTKVNFSRSRVSKVTDRQTDKQTDATSR